MDNLPPQLQSRLINLKFCIQKCAFPCRGNLDGVALQNQSPEQTLSALDELTNLLSTHYQCFQKAHEALQQLHSSTQARQVNLPLFSGRKPTPMKGINRRA